MLCGICSLRIETSHCASRRASKCTAQTCRAHVRADDTRTMHHMPMPSCFFSLQIVALPPHTTLHNDMTKKLLWGDSGLLLLYAGMPAGRSHVLCPCGLVQYILPVAGSVCWAHCAPCAKCCGCAIIIGAAGCCIGCCCCTVTLIC
jgi:hypothetical protein